MNDLSDISVVTADDFARRFSLRAGNLMWFLGAGASASSGIPTAWDMIWEFKQRLYISQRRVSPKSVADLSSDSVRRQLQSHIDAAGGTPAADDPLEFAVLFERAFPAEADRRAYIDSKMAGAKPSFGHTALATLMHADLTRLVWTTNFDPLVADACARVFGSTGSLSDVALDAPDLATQLIGDQRWPIEIKLHGDFRSRRLKNTGDELRHQDARLRKVFVDCCGRHGLVVAGYSGRDDSVMDALEEAIKDPDAFPAGLFWLHRGEQPPLPRVVSLLEHAESLKADAALVRIENFDEAMRDLVRLIGDIDTDSLDGFAADRSRCSAAPLPAGGTNWPVIRLNALPVTAPTVCRRVECDVGGYADTRAAVESAGINAIVSRKKIGVLAFGRDSELRTAFESFQIREFDLYTLEKRRLRYDSQERGLLRDALASAIARERAMDLAHRRNSDLLAPSAPQDTVWAPLRRLVGPVLGVVKDCSDLRWREGISTRLDWADDRLWLVFDPCTVFDGINDDNRSAAADFARERTVKRYNRQLNDLVDFWTGLLSQNGSPMRALGIGDGVDASFKFERNTGFSWRATA